MSRRAALEQLVRRARDVLGEDGRVEAAWLEGSLASGTADDWSDVDVHAAVADESFDAVVRDRHALLGRMGRVMGYGENPLRGGFLVHANLEGLLRLDLALLRASEVASISSPHVRVLFDRSGVTAGLMAQEGVPDVKSLVEGQIRGFFFGCFQPLRLWNRGEWGSLQMGCYMVLFQHVVPLWLAVDDPAKAFRPHLHNERFLAPARRERVQSFLSRLHEAFAGTPPEVEAAKRVQAEVFEMAFEALLVACVRWDAGYPKEFEASVRGTYREELGLAL